MNDQQLNAIVALLSGMQLSIVHLSNVICASTSLNREDLATSFEETAERIPDGIKNREILQAAVRQVASGIRNSGAGEEWEKLLSRLLH